MATQTCNSRIFRNAHAIARATRQSGDSYAATFAAALRWLYAAEKKKEFKAGDRSQAIAIRSLLQQVKQAA